MDSWARVADVVKSGRYGKVLVSRGLCYKPRKSIGVKPNTEAPATIDYNLWLGPGRSTRSTPTMCTTNGTGSGISATVTLATRGCIRWTSPAG